MSDTALAETLSASDVAAYLRKHPEFLADYPDLAGQLTLPREQGSVASLAAYQLQSLREKNAELEAKLASLVSIAAENEKLMQRVHDLNVTVLRASTPAVAARSVVARLSEDFHTDQIRLVLFGNANLPPADWLVQAPGGRASMPEFADFLANASLSLDNQNASNPELVPTQDWDLDFEVKKALGKWGSSDLKLYARWYQDYTDIIPLPGGVEARGNIPRARLYGVNPIVVVSDNRNYGTIAMHHINRYPGRPYEAATRLENPDFAAWARAFGAEGITIGREDEIAPAIAQAFAVKDRPVVVHVHSSAEQMSAWRRK